MCATSYDNKWILAEILKLRLFSFLFLAAPSITLTSSSRLRPLVMSLEATPINKTTLCFLMLDVILNDC